MAAAGEKKGENEKQRRERGTPLTVVPSAVLSHSRQTKGTRIQGVIQKEDLLMINFWEQGSQE